MGLAWPARLHTQSLPTGGAGGGLGGGGLALLALLPPPPQLIEVRVGMRITQSSTMQMHAIIRFAFAF
jgi:hypothetical protein